MLQKTQAAKRRTRTTPADEATQRLTQDAHPHRQLGQREIGNDHWGTPREQTDLLTTGGNNHTRTEARDV